MTPKNTADPEENPLGVLDEAASLDTANIGILGRTAQVRVTLPRDEDDDLADDGVVDGEVVGDLIVDDPSAASSASTVPKPAAVSAAAPENTPLSGRQTEQGTRERRAYDPSSTAADEPISAAPAIDEPPLFTDRIVIDAPGPAAPQVEHVVEAELVEETDAVDDAEAVDEADAVDDAEAVDEMHAADEIVAADEADAVDELVASEEPAIDEAEPTVDDTESVDEPEPAAKPGPAPEAEKTAAAQFLARADADARAAARSAVATPTQASIEKENAAVSTPEEKSVVPQPTRAAARADVTLTSKRLDELGDSSRESADLLTADRLLDPHRMAKPEPEGAWSHFLYAISGRRINIGDGRRARERKALSARIAAPLSGGARFVPVLSRKGGVGKTTITALLGMALADAREDRVIAVDANPDRGTLAERIVRPHHNKSVRDLVRIHDEVRGYHDISAIVARDATRLDVLASDADPRIAEAFSDNDYRDVAEVAAHYYSLVLTDTGTGIVHSVMSATLDLADQIVIVSGLSVDEARLASETLTWLETNGYSEQAREAIVVLNQSTPGTPLVRLNELQAHFATRAKSVIRMPYDPQIAGGGTIVFANLLPETRIAARELAALLVEGLRAKAA